MILFRDTYKSAFKDIEPDSELLSKILVAGLEKKKVIHKKWVYSFGSVAASFALVVCSVIGYMNFADVNDVPGVVDNTYVRQVSEPYINETLVENNAENDIVKEKATPIERKENNALKQVISGHNIEKTVPTQENSSEPLNTDVPSAASHEPMPASEPLGEAAYSAEENPVQREVSHIEDMPLSDYYQYIGFNVLEKISVPSDFVYSADSTVPYDKTSDVAMFAFLGDNSRFANISFAKIAKDSLDENISPEEYEENNGIYNVKGMADTFSFEILTNINEQELKELTDSLEK